MKKILTALFILALAAFAFAQEAPTLSATEQSATEQSATEQSVQSAPVQKERTPVTGKVTIAADHMETILKKIAKLDGNVEVVFYPEGETLAKVQKQFKGDGEVRVILNAEHMTLYFAEEESEAASRPEKILATERVRIHTPDGRSATGDQAEWDMTNGGVIVLEGKCTVVSEGRVMNSSRIIYDIEGNRLEAERAIITLPVQSKKGKTGSNVPLLDALQKPAEEKN